MSSGSSDDARQWLWRFGVERAVQEKTEMEREILIFKKEKMCVVVLMAGL